MKYTAIVFVAFLGLAAAQYMIRDVVKTMSMDYKYLDEELKSAMQILSKPTMPERYRSDNFFKLFSRDPKTKLSAFQWKNCGASGSAVDVTTLKVSPDPVSLPGDITIGFGVTIDRDVTTNLTVKLDLKKKFAGGELPIPCLDKFIGSCTYSLCDILKNVDCPPEFVANGVPCKCPFNKGKYNLPGISFTVLASVFLSGDYHAIAHISDAQGDLGCLEIFASIVNG